MSGFLEVIDSDDRVQQRIPVLTRTMIREHISWWQRRRMLGFTVSHFPGGVVAAVRIGETTVGDVMIYEPSRDALASVELPGWLRAPVGAPER